VWRAVQTGKEPFDNLARDKLDPAKRREIARLQQIGAVPFRVRRLCDSHCPHS
jgi:hypothetical protein